MHSSLSSGSGSAMLTLMLLLHPGPAHPHTRSFPLCLCASMPLCLFAEPTFRTSRVLVPLSFFLTSFFLRVQVTPRIQQPILGTEFTEPVPEVIIIQSIPKRVIVHTSQWSPGVHRPLLLSALLFTFPHNAKKRQHMQQVPAQGIASVRIWKTVVQTLNDHARHGTYLFSLSPPIYPTYRSDVLRRVRTLVIQYWTFCLACTQ